MLGSSYARTGLFHLVVAVVVLAAAASHAPWWVWIALGGGGILLLRGPLGAWLGHPAAKKDEEQATAVASRYLEPGEQIEAVVREVVGWFGMKARSLVLTDRRVLVIAGDELERTEPRGDVHTVSFGSGSQAPYELVLRQPDGNRFFLQVVPAFRREAERVADALRG